MEPIDGARYLNSLPGVSLDCDHIAFTGTAVVFRRLCRYAGSLLADVRIPKNPHTFTGAIHEKEHRGFVFFCELAQWAVYGDLSSFQAFKTFLRRDPLYSASAKMNIRSPHAVLNFFVRNNVTLRFIRRVHCKDFFVSWRMITTLTARVRVTDINNNIDTLPAHASWHAISVGGAAGASPGTGAHNKCGIPFFRGNGL